MARLETYTASGQTRSGPVAAEVPESALTRQYVAMGNLGGSIANSGDRLAAIGQQRQKENDFRWAEEASTNFKDAMIKWQTNPENIAKETVGDDYRKYADESIAEMLKSSPNQQAGEMFKRKVIEDVQRDYESHLRLGEKIRFGNFERSQVNGSTVDNEAYRVRYTIDPDGAEYVLEKSLTNRLASIKLAYGQIAPANAAQMSEQAVANAVLGTMDTDPGFARHLLDKHNAAVDPQTREVLLNKIETAENNAKATGNFNAQKQIENSIRVGYKTLTPVPPPDTTLLSANQAQKAVHDVAVANTVINEYSKLQAWNWQEQQKAIAGMQIDGAPVSGEAQEHLQQMAKKAQTEQTEDPAGWQQRNDPEFKGPSQGDRTTTLRRMVSLQGAPPPGTPEDQRKRYLNLPTGLQHASSKFDATTRAAEFNNSPPNQLTQAVDAFNAANPDDRIAAMLWNDMMTLPNEGERLKMGIRVATAINDVQVRNHFLGAMSNDVVFKTEDGKATFANDLEGNDDYRRFVSAWVGDGNQRGTQLKEFRDSILRYSEFIAGSDKLKTSAAIERAVARVITDNYKIMTVNGQDLAIYRFDRNGRSEYSERDYDFIRDGMIDAISSVTVNDISTNPFHFPKAPGLPGDPAEQNRYIQKALRTGTVMMEPDNRSATIYLRGEGENDVAFQVRGYDGLPLELGLESMLARGVKLYLERDTPAGRQRQREASERRLGIPPSPRTVIKEVSPPLPSLPFQ